MQEAEKSWTTENRNPRIECFVSIGAGNPDIRSIEGSIWDFSAKEISYIASEASKAGEDFFRAHEDLFLTGRAFRFEVGQAIDGVGLEEHKHSKVVATATRNYLRSAETTTDVQRCATRLTQKDSALPT